MRFARAAARLDDVRFLGVFQEEPKGKERRMFDDIVRIDDGLSAKETLAACMHYKKKYGPIHRLLGILEPLQVQLAEVRDRMGIEGTGARTADLFRDKARMKDALRAAGLPVAKHKLVRGRKDALDFAEEAGFPIVLKPPAGMGAKATFRVNDVASLLGALEHAQPSPERPVLAEEFLQGREFSFETITTRGQVRFHSISHYLPSCLEVLENPWIQWVCQLPRDISGSEYDGAREIGLHAVRALGLNEGFTHMEWFQRADGSLAIGEIAQRPPGAHITRMTGIAHDFDPYRAWARAVVDDAFDGPYERGWSVACCYLRGMGQGRVAKVENVDAVQKKIGKWVEEAKLPTPGAPKSDSYEGDGYVILKDRSTDTVKKVSKYVLETLRVVYA